MLSNSTHYKLKASKSARDNNDYDYNHSDDNYENNSLDGDLDHNQKYVYFRENRFRRGGRSRATEFRSTRINERRGGGGGYRGRGGGSSNRRGDREDYYILNRKYDCLPRSLDNSGSYHRKVYDVEKKNDIKLNLPEDTRISKLLRRLNIETDQENSLAISKKLLEVLLLPDNAHYVRKAFHILGESMYEILQVSPGPLAKQQSARALGRMGYIMGQENDFDRYQNWLFSKMNNTYDEIEILLMKSFKETLEFEKKKPVLEEHSENLMQNLVSSLETTENAEVFKTILDILMSLVEIYPNCFYQQFRDTIDLLFGWHIDHTQPLSNIEFISKNLQRIPEHFKFNLDFSVTLIHNFLEDISTNELSDLNDSNSFERVTVLILALNTVLKCLGDSFTPQPNTCITIEFVTDCLKQIIKTTTAALDLFVLDNLVIAANECIGILLEVLKVRSLDLSNLIYNLIDLELSMVNDFCDMSIVSMSLLLSKIIKEISGNLPIEFIEKLIGPKSEFIKLRNSNSKTVQESIIFVYQSLLNLRSVPLLQETYRFVLGDLEMVFRGILPDIQSFIQNNPFIDDDIDLKIEFRELQVLFLLRCLSQLTSANSIVVMWTLKPNLLELLGVYLQPYNKILADKAPSLQYSLLYTLYSHSKSFNHFISSSNLVEKNQPSMIESSCFKLSDPSNIDDLPNISPNIEKFAIILDIINKTLNIETSCEIKLLLLKWLNDILINSDCYLENFYNNEKFIAIINVLIKCGYHFNNEIVLMVCENLEKLLKNKQLCWSNSFLINICDLCKLHMDSNNLKVREKFSNLFLYIPWDITIVQLNQLKSINNNLKKTTQNNKKSYSNYMITIAQHLHLNGTIFSEMYPLQFKIFTNYLLKSDGTFDSNWLEDLFTCCWTNVNNEIDFFYDLTMNSKSLLENWATFELAQFCVNYKLRTPLGKPNETFMKIECSLNQLGNNLINKNKSIVGSNYTKRVQLLLQFIEHLEKSIYNASEGCATAMPQSTKQVRSFFIANSNTCNEWLSRIRMVIIHIALNIGNVCIALRHGQALLNDYVLNGRNNTIEFERILMFVTLSLLHLDEPEAITGLYVWCKNLVSGGKKCLWIKYASEQASKKYEFAIEGYKKILNESDLDIDIKHFISDQIIFCYKELYNWNDLLDWKNQDDLIKNNENGRRYSFTQTNWDCIKNLSNFDSDQSFQELSKWDFKNEPNSWSKYDILSTIESNLFNTAFNVISINNLNDKEIDSNLLIIQKAIENQLNYTPSDFLQNFCIIKYISYGLKNLLNNTTANSVFLVSENFENEIDKIDSSVLRKILWWSEYFVKVQNQNFDTFCNNLRLDIIKRARKEKNFQLAQENIVKFLKNKNLLFDDSINEIENLPMIFLNKIKDINIWSLDLAKVVTEIIKLSYSVDNNKQDTFNLCAIASTEISKFAELNNGGIELKKISSKILLNLANWLQTNEQISLTELNSPLGKLLLVLPEIGMMDNSFSDIIPLNEMAIGKLLQFSVHQCSNLAKSWNLFGTWCYRWGRKMIDQNSDIKNKLTEDDINAIKTILPPDCTENDLSKIFSILSQTRSNLDDEDIVSDDINTSEMIQNQLQHVNILQNANESDLKNLVQIWRNIQKRIYSYYSLSAEAYFKYLHLTLNSENLTKSTECHMITVTLRLLRLIVKYALELQNILEDGLQTTPTQPWKVIIPQLFSRLNHPEGYVRHRVSDLLCRVAEDAPQLITFPAVVGALEGGLKFDFSEISLPKDCLSQNNDCNNDENDLNEDDDNNYDSDPEESTNALQSCFKTMVDTLSKQDPETITQVQTLVKELRRITLLWDELWLGTLAQHQTEINKRQQQLEIEIEKVNENSNLTKDEKLSLITEKHRIIIKPIIFVLEQLQDVTSVEAETPHEKQFQEKYLFEINDVINKLKNPENPEKPQESLQPLKSLQKKFQQKFHKRISYQLKMHEISPVLASIKNTVIAMPGLATSSKSNVTISHVSNIVNILPTKTKPKKLIFYGSDGQTYTYLFKGLEDLHLDERIMQFLSIANTMMAENAEATDRNFYHAKHYSVIPLGPRSGLISWVDGTTPTFALYKRWQQREMAKLNIKNNLTTNQTILRPSELFYNKLNPLLKEHGVKNIENRKEWPLSVLKQVLTELMSETPSDLLAKELWCNSINAATWWQVVKTYSYSVAVMSIIGYIIGLGDRHLDNVLIDLTSGEIVHIDYNVCFEKGKTLRVPEKVPFRLTPNIRGALGVTGVEGIFRIACENVLKTMRKGRETLLTLLEAFVYDPLIDWTVGGEVLAGTTFGSLTTGTNSKQSKKDLEKEVTVSMFNVRCTEMRVEWNENKENILKSIPSLVDDLNQWLSTHKNITEIEDLLQDLHQQMALVKEAEAHGANKHSLYTLPMRYNAYCKSQETVNVAKRDLNKIISDSEKHLLMYDEALKILNGQQLNHWLNGIKININNDGLSVFDLVKEFLHNAGKNDIITQCEKSENEIIQLSQHQNLTIRRCLQLLQEFNDILNQCPKNFTENHRMFLFLKWSKYLLEHKTNDDCNIIFEEFRSFLDLSNSQHILQFSFNLEAYYKDTINQVNKLYEELTKTTQHDTNLETLYNDARLGITTFLTHEKGGATKALEFVIANELVMLNKNFLTLETAANRSGDLLIKLTSRDGDWFLDDLVLNSTRAVEMINNLPLTNNDEDENFLKVLNGIKIANNVYKGLHELHFNFHTIILLESMKKIQSEESSVVEMINDLKCLITDVGTTIPDLIIQLEKILSCLYMQMDVDSSYETILQIVATIRLKFKKLIHTNSNEILSQGKMLLMGFNGLFEKLSQEMDSLINVLGDLNVPISWKKIDQVKEAKIIAAHIFDPKVHSILEDIFLLKRLQTMSDFFILSQEMCNSLKNSGKIIIYNDEQLLKPVRQFIADFISRQLLGITTESIAYCICYILQHLSVDVTHEIEQKDIGAENKVPLDELCHKVWNYLLKRGIFTQNVLSQASSLETNLKTAWEKIQEPKKIELKFALLKSSAIRIQNQLTVHNFMYEEILNQLNVYTTTSNHSSIRNKFLLELKNEMSTLKEISEKLIEAREKQQILIENSHQRLNWAKGANPNVNEISAAFNNAVQTKDLQLNFEQKIVSDLLAVCKIIYQHEQLRTHCIETKTYDKLFLNTCDSWRLACQYNNSKIDGLTTTEESIMNLLTPELVNNPKWLQEITEIISDNISTQQTKLNDEQANLFCLYDKIVRSIEKFNQLYNLHCKLMGDVKPLVKTMTKIDEFSISTQKFITSYRKFIDNFTNLYSKLKKEATPISVNEALNSLKYIEENTVPIYDSLLNLESNKNHQSKFVRQNCTISNTAKMLPQKQESITKGQQRNAYAVSVWRRVKMKLEGRDPDPNRKYTPQEQVDYVIREATNLDNLALLYEGWTPWV